MNKINFLKEENARHVWQPMAHPKESMDNPSTIITGGDGVHITDIDGNRVVDAVGGLWNVNLGYSCQSVKDAITAQLAELPYYSMFRGTTNDKAIELGDLLREFFEPDGLTRAFYTSGGSDSVEVALKLARQYHRIRGESGRSKYISLHKGYHGTHFGGASVNGNAKFRHAYEPLLAGCVHIPGPYLYRNPYDASKPEELAKKCAQALEQAIEFEGAHTVAAFIMEPVQGAGGVNPPHASFMPMAREICDRHGVLMISDEVITGFGRTGSPTGAQHWGVQPDFSCTAKAITNGYFPFGAVMIHERVAEVFEAGDGGASIDTGYTYSGHPVGAAAAIACMKETTNIKPWENAAPRGAELKSGLMALAEKYSIIGDVRGEGLMCAIEFVADQKSKAPAAPSVSADFQRAAYEAGSMIRVSGPNAIYSPPLVISKEDVETILASTEVGLKAVS